ncbi:hypothetical protein NM208_g16352 [Fusarium decemcellulare]|uniref:Uncharacterized protein n=1 Tax=Fusarium decemcellulare TaxID=57161 RepID=A0ACC1RD02_9HYPO|nr:hypothetical protein NM208_g16352 [Fusarium decemcellulare]
MAVISDLYFGNNAKRTHICPSIVDLVLGEVSLFVEPVDDLGDTLFDRLLVGLDGDLGAFGLLVRGRDASELLDLTSAGLLVEALGVTLLSDLEGNVDEDLDKRDSLVTTLVGLGVQLTGDLTVSSVLVEAEADVVAVETVGGDAEVEEVLLEGSSDSGLARGRKAGEPDGEAALTTELVALTAGEGRVPGDVAGSC